MSVSPLSPQMQTQLPAPSHANSLPPKLSSRTTVSTMRVVPITSQSLSIPASYEPIKHEDNIVCETENGEHSLTESEIEALERDIITEESLYADDGGENWILYVVLAALYVFLLYIPGGIFNAIMSNLQQDFFAGPGVHCEDDSSSTVCSDANSKATWINGIGDGLGAILAMLSSPLIGRLSDAFGRKIFIIFAAILIWVPSICISAYWLYGFNMWWFIVISNIASLINPPFIMLAFLADQVPQRYRAVSFGILISATQLPNCVGALVTAFTDWNTSLWVQLVSATLGMILAVFLPESLPVVQRVSLPHSLWAQLNPFPLIKSLFRYKMFARLGLVVLLNSFTALGLTSILSTYLIQTLNASTKFQSYILLFYGGLGVLSGSFLMALLTKHMSNKSILFLGCFFTTATFPLLAIAGDRAWAYWPPLGLLALSNLVFPSASAMKSLNCSASEQGKIQGALYGVLSIGTCIGETTMGFILSAFIKKDSKVPYFPPAVMIYAIPFSLASAILVLYTPGSIPHEDRLKFEIEAKEAEKKRILLEEQEEQRAQQQEEVRKQWRQLLQQEKAERERNQNMLKNSLNHPLMDGAVSNSSSVNVASSAGAHATGVLTSNNRNNNTSNNVNIAASRSHTPPIQHQSLSNSLSHSLSHSSSIAPHIFNDESDESAASAVTNFAENF